MSQIYTEKTRKKRNDYSREWRKNNPERVKELGREYRKKNRDKVNAANREWYKNNKEEGRKLNRAGYYRNKEKNIARSIKKAQERLASWEKYLPKEANCEVCGKNLYLCGKSISNRICFDHKNEDLAIKTNPSIFLRQKFCTKENISIWESCDFGILCVTCNKNLPTKNRAEWLRKALDYANK
jgi:hypothetical protein